MDLNVNFIAYKRSITVSGTFFDKNVNYQTKWRNTEGLIAGRSYKMYVEGIKDKDKNVIGIKSKGSIGDYEISGTATKINENVFKLEEHYGPLTALTSVNISSLVQRGKISLVNK